MSRAGRGVRSFHGRGPRRLHRKLGCSLSGKLDCDISFLSSIPSVSEHCGDVDGADATARPWDGIASADAIGPQLSRPKIATVSDVSRLLCRTTVDKNLVHAKRISNPETIGHCGLKRQLKGVFSVPIAHATLEPMEEI